MAPPPPPPPAVITRVLIANRGEIACRAQRACRKLGLGSVAVFTEVDALSLHVLQATGPGETSVCLGAGPKEYLNADKLIEVAQATGGWVGWAGRGWEGGRSEDPSRCGRTPLIDPTLLGALHGALPPSPTPATRPSPHTLSPPPKNPKHPKTMSVERAKEGE